MQYEKLNKKAKWCMLLGELTIAVVFTVTAVIVWGVFREQPLLVDVNYLLAAAGVVDGICVIAPFVRYERYRYRFTDEEIDVVEGFLFVERNIVPIERLHKIAMQSGPIDRICGLSKVIVTTAGGDVVIRFLETQKAEQIVEQLKKRINQYAVEGRMNELEQKDAK